MVTGTGNCPTPEQLEGLLREDLTGADRTAVEIHVETCTRCQAQLEQLVAGTLPMSRPTVISPSGHAAPDDAFLQHLRQLPLPTRAPAPAAPVEEPGPAEIGPYEILGRLGSGGMGTVYRARHRELDKIVALKVLPADRVDEAALARFRNEMRATGRLTHHNIVAAHDAGRVGGTYFLAMDFVDGSDLSALVRRLGPLSVPDACELVRQAAIGLQHAGECGLAHRDVKPSNLMLAKDGAVKVLDLGLARTIADLPEPDRLTATGIVVGTADYIAPEQIDRAHTADARSDVYGLGGTLYFLLTGAPPFGGYRTWLDKLRAHAEAPVPSVRQRRPDTPAELAALVEQMLAKAPDERPPSPGAVAEALQSFATGSNPAALLTRDGADPVPLFAAAPPPAPRLRGTILRYGLAAIAGAAVALLGTAPFLLANREREREPDAPPAPPKPRSTEEPEGVRLTFGQNGPLRPDNKVLPGEVIFLEVASSAGRDNKGDVSITIGGELLDGHGKRWAELLPSPVKGPRYIDGSALNSWVSFELKDDQPPGEYRARARVTDKVSGRVADVEHPVYVLKPEFGALRLCLTHDKEGKWPAGGHLTIGQEFFVQLRVANYARENGRVDLAVKFSARDRDGKETTPAPIPPAILKAAVEAGSKLDLNRPLRTIMAGEAVIGVELEDRIAKKTAAYELPVVIHPPRSSRPPGQPR